MSRDSLPPDPARIAAQLRDVHGDLVVIRTLCEQPDMPWEPNVIEAKIERFRRDVAEIGQWFRGCRADEVRPCPQREG